MSDMKIRAKPPHGAVVYIVGFVHDGDYIKAVAINQYGTLCQYRLGELKVDVTHTLKGE